MSIHLFKLLLEIFLLCGILQNEVVSMTTGQRIKVARKKAGMTQAELAQKLGIPFQSVSQWERDLRNPKIETLQRIAAALGVSLDDLLELRPLPDDLAKVFLTRSIGPNIVALRQAANMSQKELSEKTGIPLKYLQSFESGTGGYFPTEDDLLRISGVFGIIPEHIKGTALTQELLLEMIERSKAPEKSEPPAKNITFNATPDPEWVELEKKMEDGTITPDEAQRYRDLADQSMESIRRMIPKAKQRILGLLDSLSKLSDGELRVVSAMVEQMIAERPPTAIQAIPGESEGKDTAPEEKPPTGP